MWLWCESITALRVPVEPDAAAAREPAREQRPRHAVGHRIEARIAELARHLFAAEIHDRGLAAIAVAADQVAEIGEGGHSYLPIPVILRCPSEARASKD